MIPDLIVCNKRHNDLIPSHLYVPPRLIGHIHKIRPLQSFRSSCGFPRDACMATCPVVAGTLALFSPSPLSV